MKQTQDNVTTMFETVDAYLQKNSALWSGMPAFAKAVGSFEAGIAVIRQKQADQAKTGDTQEKKDARATAEDLIIRIGAQLSALAAVNNDPMLGAKVDFNKAIIHKMALSDLMTTGNTVSTEANNNAAVLTSDYNIAAGDLKELDSAIKGLDGVKDAPRLAITDQHVATLSLPEAIRYVRGILRTQMDKMMEAFKASQADFYAGYFAARVVVDRPGSHKGKADSSSSATGSGTGSTTPPAK